MLQVNRNTDKKRIVLIMCVLSSILFLSIFPRLYILKEINHNCSGKDCPICMEIEAIAQVSNTLQSSYQVVPSILAFILVVIISTQSFTNVWCQNTTLITLKVELLN